MTASDAPRISIARAAFPVHPGAWPVVGTEVRNSIFVRLERGDALGFGECAPLAGVHPETTDECAAVLEPLQYAPPALAWDDETEVDRWMATLPAPARFAFSCARETFAGLGALPCEPSRVAAFFPGGADELDDSAVAALADAPVVKLKIGRASESEERAFLARALAALPGATFRVDGNRRLTLAECTARVRGLDAARFEYLEEPLRDPSELGALHRATGIPVALDESVREPAPPGSPGPADLPRMRLSSQGGVCAWVLRMSAFGDLSTVRRTAAEAEARGIDVVLSTAYESSWSLRLAVQVAASIPNARRAHGIGTAHVLSADACLPALPRAGILDGQALPIPIAEAWE
jgi:o-succinylbenzoate synthase